MEMLALSVKCNPVNAPQLICSYGGDLKLTCHISWRELDSNQLPHPIVGSDRVLIRHPPELL